VEIVVVLVVVVLGTLVVVVLLVVGQMLIVQLHKHMHTQLNIVSSMLKTSTIKQPK
jgi:hypothetical protein